MWINKTNSCNVFQWSSIDLFCFFSSFLVPRQDPIVKFKFLLLRHSDVNYNYHLLAILKSSTRDIFSHCLSLSLSVSLLVCLCFYLPLCSLYFLSLSCTLSACLCLSFFLFISLLYHCQLSPFFFTLSIPRSHLFLLLSFFVIFSLCKTRSRQIGSVVVKRYLFISLVADNRLRQT